MDEEEVNNLLPVLLLTISVKSRAWAKDDRVTACTSIGHRFLPQRTKTPIKYPTTKVSGCLQKVKGLQVTREATVPQGGGGWASQAVDP